MLGYKIFPDLSGKWEGHLESTWIDTETKQVKPRIAAKITIHQGLFATSVTLRTEETPTSYLTRHLEAFHDIRRLDLVQLHE